MRGRKPRPSHLKLLDGNPGHRSLNANEPKPAKIMPTPPVFLAGEALAEWRAMTAELSVLGLLTGIDKATLAAYCQAWARWHQAEKALAMMAAADPVTSALMVKTAGGTAIQNPIVGIANRAMSDMVKYAAEFGMSPSARSRIHVDERLSQEPLARLLKLPQKRA